MYVANRVMKAACGDKIVEYRPGDVIPDFDKWNEVAKRANLNLGYVIREDGVAPAAPVKKETKGTEPVTDLFGCKLCPKSFKAKKSLNLHITLSHKKEA